MAEENLTPANIHELHYVCTGACAPNPTHRNKLVSFKCFSMKFKKLVNSLSGSVAYTEPEKAGRKGRRGDEKRCWS